MNIRNNDINNSRGSALFPGAEGCSTEHTSLCYTNNWFPGYFVPALWCSYGRGADSLLRELFWKELCWLQGEKSVVGDGCWGLSVLRGTLKLPKAFSRLVPFCQKCLRSLRAPSQLWKMQRGNSSRKDKKAWQNQEEQCSGICHKPLDVERNRNVPSAGTLGLQELGRTGGTAKC